MLILGAGPAGLAAAARLLERGSGKVRVSLMDLSASVGGKAASYRTDDGLLVEHGWHMVVGFYENLPSLLRWAGIEPGRALATMGGRGYTFEPWHGRLHTTSSRGGKLAVAADFAAYEGLPLEDRGNMARVMAEAFRVALSGEDLTRHDDICFDSWAVERGLRRHVTHYSIFRFLRLAYFNFPEQISAYHMLETMRKMATSEAAELYVARGGTTEVLWNPLAGALRARGATFAPRVCATDFVYEADRIVGVRVADARGVGPLARERLPEDALPVVPGTERLVGDFDAVISTVPVFALRLMNAGDTRLWRSAYFRRFQNLRGVATLSFTVLTERPVGHGYFAPVHGFPAPLGFFVDMKPYWPEFTRDPGVGSVLVFGGQETGFESWTDEQIASFTLDNVARAPGIGDVRRAGIVRMEMHRNRMPWERLLLAEPGVHPFRPSVLTPFQNLYLAGDWVRNATSLVSMEGAVTSGFEAADALLARGGSGA